MKSSPKQWQVFNLLVTGHSQDENMLFITAISTHFANNFGRIVPEDYLYMNLLEMSPAWLSYPDWDEVRKMLLNERMMGFVLIVDSTQPETFIEAKSLIVRFSSEGHPYIVAVNKQDQSSAWPVEDLRIILDLPSDIAIVSCDVSDKGSVKNVLLRLMYKVLDEIALPE